MALENVTVNETGNVTICAILAPVYNLTIERDVTIEFIVETGIDTYVSYF